jgi:hypothetical protein
MMLEILRSHMRQRPFLPFRLIMSSGQAYEIRRPETAFLTRTDILVGTDILEDGIPSEFKICSLLHVARVESLSSGPMQSAES